MGIWAGIKHALNSTLGTDDFIPLDKMISNQMRMVESDEVYSYLESFTIEQKGYAEEEKFVNYPAKIKMTRYGKAYLKATIDRNTVDANIKFRIFKNNELIYTFEKRWDSSGNTFEISQKIDFVPNDVFSFDMCTRNLEDSDTRTSTLTVKNFTINGTMKYNAYIENAIEVVE